ncbi:MAG: putative lysis protein [Wruxavirus humenecus]|uniref:Lysis protein n=1 Tax=Leviviridae sp. TaxID=2027243 RepID=A0ABY4D620_9VIRU|nr:MAG: putative lysis protein [Leviviridae sp.]
MAASTLTRFCRSMALVQFPTGSASRSMTFRPGRRSFMPCFPVTSSPSITRAPSGSTASMVVLCLVSTSRQVSSSLYQRRRSLPGLLPRSQPHINGYSRESCDFSSTGLVTRGLAIMSPSETKR